MGTALATTRMEERLDSGPSRKVLLVDENAEDLHAYTEVLRRQGCDVRACDSFREGQGCLEAGSFDRGRVGLRLAQVKRVTPWRLPSLRYSADCRPQPTPRLLQHPCVTLR